jgi:uncharacterized membrane protein
VTHSWARAYLHGMRTSVWPVWKLRSGRVWEVDAWRGVAICIMVVYHLMWDLRSLAGYEIAVRSGFWSYWQIATAGLFTILVGVSLTLSYNRERETHPTGSLWSKYVVRGLTVFTWGLLVSVATLVALGRDEYVRFGILHLIGISIIIAYPLLRFRWLNLILGVLIIGLGPAMRAWRPDFPWLEWLAPTPGSGVDYAPLIPMFGRVLIGVFLGNLLYPGGARRFRTVDFSDRQPIKTLRRMGQNSLLIYIVHQPILIGILLVLGVVDW